MTDLGYDLALAVFIYLAALPAWHFLVYLIWGLTREHRARRKRFS